MLLAAVILSYQPVWQAGYIWDDDMYVTNNPLLTAADGWWRIWFSFDAPSQYFPLTYSTLRLEHALWGLNAAGYHWTNILLQGVNALLLWRLLHHLRVPGAWFAASLFALHPVQVESVAWISERKNVLMGLFFLLTLLTWRRFDDAKNPRRWIWYAVAFVPYLLALSAKTTACTLPAALVLICWWERKPLVARRWLEIAPYVFAGAGAGVISMMWERLHQFGRPDFIPIPLLERVLIFSRALWFYMSKLAWPAELIFSYPRWEISPANASAYFWPIALLVLVAGIVFARRRLGRGPEIAFAFYVATLAPLLGVAIVITFLYSFVADHYQYLACIGPLTLFAAFCYSGKQWIARTATGVVLPVLAFLTWQQAHDYRDEETLWRHTLARNPESWMARNNLGGYYLSAKRFEEAIEQYRALVAQRPNESLGYANLGAALARKGETDAAIAEYERAIALDANDPRVERNLAQALVTKNRPEEAIAHFERALELRGLRRDVSGAGAEIQRELSGVLVRRANASMQKRDVEPAIADYRKAITLRSDYAEAHANLGTALLLQGNLREAIRELEATLALEPNSVPALNNLARLLATAPEESLRDGSRAKELASKAVEITKARDPMSLRALAAAEAERGEFSDAEDAANRAIDLVGASNPAFAQVLRLEKENYSRHERRPAR